MNRTHGTNSSYEYGCRCDLCKAANKQYRILNKERIKRIARDTKNVRLDLLVKLKSVPCKDCGITYPPYVMDFDHRDPKEKSFTFSKTQGCSTKRLLAEAAKCDVVCANCHRERTFKNKAYKDQLSG